MLFKDIKIIDEEFKVRSHMYVRTEGTRISYVGTECPEMISGEEIYDGSGKVMMPALYNLHCHIPMTFLRGYGDGLPLARWLNEKIFPFEAKLTGEDVYWSTKLGAMELLASGCVSISDMYFFINDMARSLDESGMKANLGHGISSFDPDVKLHEMKGYKDTIELYNAAKNGVYGGSAGSQTDSRIKADMGLHAEYTSTEGLVRQIADAAYDEGLSIHVHLSETASEHAECKGRHNGLTPAAYFESCGLFKNKVAAAHCVYIEDADLEIMKAAGAVAVHNPSSNLKLGSGIVSIKSFAEKGLKLTLGTDGASSNNNLNMMEELHLAAVVSRGISQDANAVSNADMLKMATLNGALAQGRTDCGLIKAGYRADIAVIDTDRPHMQPDFDTLSNIMFSAQASDVVLTMTDGKVVYKNGEYMFIDKEKVYHEVNRRFERILGEL